jgi:type IV pilus assembly protein PilO
MATDEQTRKARNKVIIVFVIFLLAIVLIPPFGLYPKIAEFTKVRLARIEKQDELATKRTKVATLDELRKSVEEAQDQIAYFERRLPNSPEAPELLNQLRRVANYTGVTYTSLDRLDTVQHKSYTEIPIKITLEADYHGLGEFINRIENSPRFAKIDNINVEANEENYFRQKVELNLSTFIFTEPEEWSEEMAVSSAINTRSVR